MANILQVSTPSVNTDNRTILNNQDIKNNAGNQNIQNPVDPSRVVRADGQESGKTGDAPGQGAYGVIDYESNYGAFIGRLAEGLDLSRSLADILFGDRAASLPFDQMETGALVEQLFRFSQMNSPEELQEFLKGQETLQAKFSGALFDGLRAALAGNPSQSLIDAAAEFMKCCNDHVSGRHLLYQMRTLTEDITHLMQRQFRGEFQELAKAMDWGAENGDIAANTAVLNQRLLPFLSAYISRTHDYGPVRDAVMLLILNAVRYENGEKDRLLQLLDRLAGNRDFQRACQGDAGGRLESYLDGLRRESVPRSLADTFSTLLLKGANGQAGLENIQQFYSILNGLLLNESVYLPLLHILAPFRYRDKEVMSEIWADPDAGKKREEGGRRIKLFLKFDIRSLGNFDMILAMGDRQVEMQLYVPKVLAAGAGKIQEHIAEILRQNGLEFGQLLVKERVRDIRVEEVFPEIREQGRTINVRI